MIWRATVIWRYGKRFIVIMWNVCISEKSNVLIRLNRYLPILENYTQMCFDELVTMRRTHDRVVACAYNLN